MTLGIRQLFRYYEMPVRMRVGSKATKTAKTNRNFSLEIEHVRAMFQVGDLRERVILSMAVDLGLRIGDFLALKKSNLPSLDQEPPISLPLMTKKENVISEGFLSQETVDLLRVYVPDSSDERTAIFTCWVEREITHFRRMVKSVTSKFGCESRHPFERQRFYFSLLPQNVPVSFH